MISGDPYVEISEDFRLYHNLYHDRTTDKYIKFDDAGNGTEVIVIKPDQVCIRLAEIRQFLAAKDMHLAIYFDNREHSRLSLTELGLTEGYQDVRDGMMIRGLSYGDFGGASESQTFSRLLGKRLLPPFPKEQCGLWRFRNGEPKRLIEFIVGVGEAGKEICAATDGHDGGVEYLTPVWFRKAVLDKYYQQPNKYSVQDSYLRCGSLWGMTMDNHHDGYVVAWLGDLGRDLPYEEQLHWRSYNIPRRGPVSKVFFKRQIEAKFADSNQPDIEFKSQFPGFCSLCRRHFGWSLFLPLAPKDQHYFNVLRIPASNEQKEFDDLVLALTKVLVDSLNEAELLRLISPDHRDKVVGGISRLERVLIEHGAAGYEAHIRFLRDLQGLRSSGSATGKEPSMTRSHGNLQQTGRNCPRCFVECS